MSYELLGGMAANPPMTLRRASLASSGMASVPASDTSTSAARSMIFRRSPSRCGNTSRASLVAWSVMPLVNVTYARSLASLDAGPRLQRGEAIPASALKPYSSSPSRERADGAVDGDARQERVPVPGPLVRGGVCGAALHDRIDDGVLLHHIDDDAGRGHAHVLGGDVDKAHEERSCAICGTPAPRPAVRPSRAPLRRWRGSASTRPPCARVRWHPLRVSTGPPGSATPRPGTRPPQPATAHLRGARHLVPGDRGRGQRLLLGRQLDGCQLGDSRPARHWLGCGGRAGRRAGQQRNRGGCPRGCGDDRIDAGRGGWLRLRSGHRGGDGGLGWRGNRSVCLRREVVSRIDTGRLDGFAGGDIGTRCCNGRLHRDGRFLDGRCGDAMFRSHQYRRNRHRIEIVPA